MIIQTLSTNQVAHLLLADEYANWSYDGANLLAKYYEELSDDLEQPFELNIVAIRCEWSEYDESDLLETYSNLIEMGQFKDDNLADIIEQLRDHTLVIEFTSGNATKFLVQEF